MLASKYSRALLHQSVDFNLGSLAVCWFPSSSWTSPGRSPAVVIVRQHMRRLILLSSCEVRYVLVVGTSRSHWQLNSSRPASRNTDKARIVDLRSLCWPSTKKVCGPPVNPKTSTPGSTPPLDLVAWVVGPRRYQVLPERLALGLFLCPTSRPLPFGPRCADSVLLRIVPR